jgi:acyl-CoA synthetase (NDP forming)
LAARCSDVVDYCADQPGLRVILCYIESIPDPAGFLDAARRARQNGKAVVTVKIGGSEAARTSALAHTGALAGSTAVFDVLPRLLESSAVLPWRMRSRRSNSWRAARCRKATGSP